LNNYKPAFILTSSHEDWMEKRRNFIGASEIGAVMGLNPFQDAQDIINIKLGKKPKLFKEDIKRMKDGNDKEPEIVKLYERKTGNKVQLFKDRIFYHPQNPIFGASLDGYVEKSSGDFVLECKYSMASFWWNNDSCEYYYPQVQQQMYVMGVNKADFAVLHPNTLHLKILTVKRDEEFIQRMLEEGFKFWQLLQNKKANLLN